MQDTPKGILVISAKDFLQKLPEPEKKKRPKKKRIAKELLKHRDSFSDDF